MTRTVKAILLLSVTAILALAAEKTPKQIQAYNFDFDDNVFSTKARIYLTEKTTHHEESVSTAEWAVVRQTFGKSGKWINFELRPEGLRDFNDKGPRGDDLFASQITEALEDNQWKWRAKSWGALVEAMHNPAKREHTAFITARMHSPDGMMKGFEILKKHGLIENTPDKEKLYIVGWDGFDERFKAPNDDSAARKAKVMMYLLDELEATPLPTDAKAITNREGSDVAPLQLWGFSDDDFGNYMTAFCVLSAQVAKGKWPHVKVVIFYSGTFGPMPVPMDTECAKRYGPIPLKMKKSDYKKLNLVIKPDGKWRELLPEEGKYMGGSVPQ